MQTSPLISGYSSGRQLTTSKKARALPTNTPPRCMMMRPRSNGLRRLTSLVSIFLLSVAVSAEEAVFRDVQFPSSKGQLTNATLKFSDESKLVEARLSDGRVVTVMYSQIDTISYDEEAPPETGTCSGNAFAWDRHHCGVHQIQEPLARN